MDYFTHLPRVEKIGEHGLFTDEGEPVVLGQVQKQMVEHKGIVWAHVISLRREDVDRLGYNSIVQWMALSCSKRAMLYEHMKIDSASLKWYAVFHNESHHPYVHLLVHSAKDREGYLIKQSIEATCLELTHDTFRQDFTNIYEKQIQSRTDLKERSEAVIKIWIDEVRVGMSQSSEIEIGMLQLSKRLQDTDGKRVYGYLKRGVEDLVDHIMDELEKDGRVSVLYREQGLQQGKIVRIYQKQPEELLPLSEQPELKNIKNTVIAEALRLGSHHFLFEESENRYPEPEDDFPIQGPESTVELTEESDSDYMEEELKREPFYNGRRGTSGPSWWMDGYKQVRNYLYGSDSASQDFEKVYQRFLQEAGQGNRFAMQDLDRMFTDGLGRSADMILTQKWYEKVLDASRVREKLVKERQKPYLQYHIGEMYASGLGTEQDYEETAHWPSRAATMDHRYAQYSLAGLHCRGQEVEKNDTRALSLYISSVDRMEG